MKTQLHPNVNSRLLCQFEPPRPVCIIGLVELHSVFYSNKIVETKTRTGHNPKLEQDQESWKPPPVTCNLSAGDKYSNLSNKRRGEVRGGSTTTGHETEVGWRAMEGERFSMSYCDSVTRFS